MSRNIILATFLVLLLAFTYFYQELGTRQAQLQEDYKTMLITTSQLGELKQIEGPYFHLKRHESGIFSFQNPVQSKHKVDQQKVEKIFEMLSHLRIVRNILEQNQQDLAWENFIPSSAKSINFIFEDNFLNFTLGNKVQTDQSFYVLMETKNKKTLLVAKDISPLQGTYLEGQYHRNDEKYRRLASLFVLTDEFLQKKTILNEKLANWSFVDIMNVRQKDFQVWARPLKTHPDIYPALSYNEQKFQDFFQSIQALEAQKVFDRASGDKLDQFLSQLTINRNDESKLYLSLYQKFRGKSGYFMVIDDGPTVYKLSSALARPFFNNIQEFWNKRALDLTKVKHLALSQDDKKVAIERHQGDKIEYEVTNENALKANHRNLEKLLSFFNHDSDRISIFDKFDKELYPHSLFTMSIGEKEFKIIKTEVELLLVDIKSQLKYHFYTGADIPFGQYLSDYFVKENK